MNHYKDFDFMLRSFPLHFLTVFKKDDILVGQAPGDFSVFHLCDIFSMFKIIV